MLTRGLLRVVLTIGIACVALHLSWSLFLRLVGLDEVSSNPRDFAPVVAEVMSGRLRPDKNGTVVLPRQYSSFTRDGRAYYLRKKDGLVLIFFLTWYAGHGNLRGCLYHNRQPSKADISWRNGDHWAVTVPFGPVLHDYEVTIDREVTSHWYHVYQSGG